MNIHVVQPRSTTLTAAVTEAHSRQHSGNSNSRSRTVIAGKVAVVETR